MLLVISRTKARQRLWISFQSSGIVQPLVLYFDSGWLWFHSAHFLEKNFVLMIMLYFLEKNFVLMIMLSGKSSDFLAILNLQLIYTTFDTHRQTNILYLIKMKLILTNTVSRTNESNQITYSLKNTRFLPTLGATKNIRLWNWGMWVTTPTPVGLYHTLIDVRPWFLFDIMILKSYQLIPEWGLKCHLKTKLQQRFRNTSLVMRFCCIKIQRM